MVEDFSLEDIDPSNQRRAHGATTMDEDDEDGVPHGAERMQCASQ
jgi:DnaJ family protein A protein 2